jgi:hypothetical protein
MSDREEPKNNGRQAPETKSWWQRASERIFTSSEPIEPPRITPERGCPPVDWTDAGSLAAPDRIG